MFTTLVVKPIFNLFVLIYGLLPGHNFGLAIIIFTIVIRLLMWPLVKKQLHQTKVMRKLQPELKKIKAASKGNRQKESQLLMELYKERGVNPLSAFPTLIIQFIVLIGLYSGLRRVIDDPQNIISFAYPSLQNLPWLQHLSQNIHQFDDTLFGIVDLSRSALGGKGGIYWPAMIIVLGSAVTQFYQAKQLLPTTKDSRSLRDILKQAGEGKQADQSEVSAAVGRSTRFLFPVLIFVTTVNFPSALGLYWFVGGLVAYIQQAIVLRDDETEMEALADAPLRDTSKIPEAEVIESKAIKPASKSKTKKPSSNKKRKKR
ncbi:membrane protein insertase YidC [Aeromicrobium sp.]|nr:membrane protein insertase YidC [Candidatus Saccharibacteria bacterium]